MAPMLRREAVRLLSIASAAALGAACQAVPWTSSPTPTTPPTAVPQPTAATTEVLAMPGVRLAIDLDPDTLDPAGQTHPTVASIVDHLAETLVRLEPDGTLAPGLARRFTQSPDGLSFTFELQPFVE